MRPLAILARLLLGIGLVVLLGAAALLLAAGAGGPGATGWDDLARVAGALLLGVAGAFAMGGALLAWARAGERPPEWQRGLAMGGAVVGLLAALLMGAVGLEGGSPWLLVVVVLAILVAGGGLVAMARAARAV